MTGSLNSRFIHIQFLGHTPQEVCASRNEINNIVNPVAESSRHQQAALQLATEGRQPARHIHIAPDDGEVQTLSGANVAISNPAKMQGNLHAEFGAISAVPFPVNSIQHILSRS